MAMLAAKQRLRAIESVSDERAKWLTEGLRELPLTGDIAILAGELQHGDPRIASSPQQQSRMMPCSSQLMPIC